MKLKTLLFGLFLATLSTAAYAEKFAIEFAEKTWDFGTIKEEDGSVTHTFEFTNIGESTLILNNVKASCGCTTPKWTKEPVAPGAKGVVNVTYNTKGRPGNFTKTITVTSNAGKSVLTIKGEVIPRTPDPSELYPVEAEGVRLRSNNIGIWDVLNTQVKSQKITVYNPSETNAVTISFANVPKHITLPASTSLNPKEAKDIEFTFDGKLVNDYGSHSDNFTLIVNNGKPSPKNKITIASSIKENLQKWQGDNKVNAPKLSTEGVNFTLGKLELNKKVSTKLKLTNVGKSTLEVRKIVSNSNWIVPQLTKVSIAPGKTVEVKLFITPTEAFNGKKMISLITNDPDNQNYSIFYQVEVVE